MKQTYIGNKTVVDSGKNNSYTYYEKAYDSQGTPLMIGDWVKVLYYDENDHQKNMVGQERKICGMFEGDLMLQDEYSYDYCWPRKTVKIKAKSKPNK